GLLLARECPFPISQRPSVDPRFRRELRGGQAAIPPTLDSFCPFLSPDPTSGRVRGLHARHTPAPQPRTSRTRLPERLPRDRGATRRTGFAAPDRFAWRSTSAQSSGSLSVTIRAQRVDTALPESALLILTNGGLV